MNHLTATQLKEYLGHVTPAPLLLDVREPWEFQTCHIDGSRNIPMSQVPADCRDLDAQQETIVICHHGMRSQRVAVYLEQAGFTNIVNLTGGVAAWAREVDPSMPTY